MLDTTTLTTEALCRSILERHQDTIQVRKPDFAIRKLTRIITAALELSNAKSFHGMSLRDLSKGSGVSMGGLYAYFDSKTTLARMILEEVTAQVRRALEAPPDAIAADPVRHLKWLIETHIRLTEILQPWFVFSFMEAKHFPRSERQLAVDNEALTEAYFARVIERGIAQGCFRPDTPALLSSLIKPLLQEWYIKRSKYHRRAVSMDDYTAAVQDIVLRSSLP